MSNESPDPRLMVAQIIALGILFSICVMTGLGLAIATGALPMGPAEMDAAAGKRIGTILLAIGVGAVGLSHVMRTAMDKRAAAMPDPALARMRAVIVSMAIGEAPATLALVNGILTHNVTATALLGAAAIITGLLHFPRARTFEG